MTKAEATTLLLAAYREFKRNCRTARLIPTGTFFCRSAKGWALIYPALVVVRKAYPYNHHPNTRAAVQVPVPAKKRK